MAGPSPARTGGTVVIAQQRQLPLEPEHDPRHPDQDEHVCQQGAAGAVEVTSRKAC